MVLIDGVGDEVTIFFAVLLIVTLGVLAWFTTSISEQNNLQTVWLLDRRQSLRQNNTNNTGDLSSVSNVNGIAPSDTVENSDSDSNTEASTDDSSSNLEIAVNTVRNRHHQRNTDQGSLSRSTSNNRAESASSSCIIPNQNTGSDGVESESTRTTKPTTRRSSLISNNSQSTLRIKLKYINDDLRLVDGRLEEKLGDFKKRHFPVEYCTRNLIRLIFNGQVLQHDTSTLQECGLFDNCVVHCVIHQRSSSNTSGEYIINDQFNTSHSRQGDTNPANNQAREWDFGNFLFGVISVMLLGAWYFRYVYTHLYTVAATVGLVLMTAMFSFIFFGVYFRDHDNQRHTTWDNFRTE